MARAAAPWRPRPLAHAAQIPTLAAVLAQGGPVSAPADPAALVDAAIHHGVAGYLLRATNDDRVALPEAATRRLRAVDLTSTVHARLLRSELDPAAAALASASGVAPVLLKGPAVADRFHADPRLRPFSDLDFLVPRDALGAAVAALERLGYRRVDGPWKGYAERHGHEVALARTLGARNLFVEVHWRLSDDPVAMGLSRALLEGGAAGSPAALAAAPLQLVVLAVHLLHEPEKRLVWINDMAVVGRALDDPAWAEAFAAAERLGLAWVLHRALDHVRRHLGFERARPAAPGPPPRWGPLRAGESLGGWIGFQAGRVGGEGWRRSDGYVRSAARARARALRGRPR